MWRQASIVINTYDDIAAVSNEISRLCHSELLDLSREGLVVAKIRDLKIIFYAKYKLHVSVFLPNSLQGTPVLCRTRSPRFPCPENIRIIFCSQLLSISQLLYLVSHSFGQNVFVERSCEVTLQKFVVVDGFCDHSSHKFEVAEMVGVDVGEVVDGVGHPVP